MLLGVYVPSLNDYASLLKRDEFRISYDRNTNILSNVISIFRFCDFYSKLYQVRDLNGVGIILSKSNLQDRRDTRFISVYKLLIHLSLLGWDSFEGLVLMYILKTLANGMIAE